MRHHPRSLTASIIIISVLIFLTGKKLIRPKSSLTLASSSFQDGGEIPIQFTCDGKNISPALHWTRSSTTPINSYVLIVDDPDAKGKTYVHWLAVLSPQITDLPEEVSPSITTIDFQAAELLNDDGVTRYKGPCPPATSGQHTYRFTLFATKRTIDEIKTDLKSVIDADEFKKGMKNYIVDMARITGRYTRKEK